MTQPFRTPAFDKFVAPARNRPALWRLILGVVVVAVLNMGALVGLIILGASLSDSFAGLRVDDAMLGTDRFQMTLLLLSFWGALAGVFLAARLLHKRSFASLFGERRMMWRHFGIAAVVYVAVQAPLVVYWFWTYDAIPMHSLASVLMWFPFAALLVLIQTGTEELMFRGYLPQQLAARLRNPIWWFILPQIAFGFMHLDPANMGQYAWAFVGFTAVLGLMWADLVRITGNIGAAWGWHFANNTFVLLLVANQGDMSGFAVATAPYSAAELPFTLLALDAAAQVVIWLILRRKLRPENSL